MQLAGSRKMCWVLNAGHDRLLTLVVQRALPLKAINEEGRWDEIPSRLTEQLHGVEETLGVDSKQGNTPTDSILAFAWKMSLPCTDVHRQLFHWLWELPLYWHIRNSLFYIGSRVLLKESHYNAQGYRNIKKPSWSRVEDHLPNICTVTNQMLLGSHTRVWSQ